MFLNGGDALSGLGDAEGEHGEVVVLLGAVAELVGVGLEGLDDVARALRSDGSRDGSLTHFQASWVCSSGSKAKYFLTIFFCNSIF